MRIKTGVFFILLFPVISFAGLGPVVPALDVPSGLCLINIQSNDGSYTEICSGFQMGSDKVITAGHCTKNINDSTFVTCDTHSSTVSKTVIPNQLNLKDLEFDPNLRGRDVAILELKNLIAPSRPLIATSETEVNETLQDSSKCAFFGFSHYLGRKNSSLPEVKAIEVDPQFLRLKDGVIYLEGWRGATALVQPGDSGGGLACRLKNNWIFIGVVSGRNWDYQSYFATTYSHPDLVQVVLDQPQPVVKRTTSPFKGTFSEKNIVSGEVYRVKPYSVFWKTEHTTVSEFFNNETLLSWGLEHSTLNHKRVEFEAVEKNGNQWVGHIRFQSFIENYSCTHGFVCSSGKMTWVKLSADRLEDIP